MKFFDGCHVKQRYVVPVNFLIKLCMIMEKICKTRPGFFKNIFFKKMAKLYCTNQVFVISLLEYMNTTNRYLFWTLV